MARFFLALVGAIVFFGTKLLSDDDTDATPTEHEFVQQHVDEVRNLVIYEKSRSLIKPEYVWKLTDDWVHFPWDERALPPAE